MAADTKTNKRTNLDRVIIDTPALLNMIKHCRESDTNSHGLLMGVTTKGTADDSLLVTQTMPDGNNKDMQELLNAMEKESQKLMDTNEIGFYTSARMGLCFRIDILTDLINRTKKFKNAVMIIYDTQKSDYGLAPLKAFRLSEKAIGTFSQN